MWKETWIEPPSARRIRSRIELNLELWGRQDGCRGAFLIGAAGAGTSSFLWELARQHPRSSGKGIALAAMPHTVELRDILVELRRAIGCDSHGRDPAHELEWHLLEELGRSDVVAIAVDAMEHLLHVTPRKRIDMLSWLWSLGRSAGVYLLLSMPSGLLKEADELYNGAIPAEAQPDIVRLSRPFQEYRLSPFRVDDEYVDLLEEWERSLPLLEASNIAERETALHLYALCDGNHGRLASMLRRAAAEAITSGRERITIDLLDGMGLRPPTTFSGFRF